jgi:hypothetical protein
MQVADVNAIRRTIIQTSEKRKVGGSVPGLRPVGDLVGGRPAHGRRGVGRSGAGCPADGSCVMQTEHQRAGSR